MKNIITTIVIVVTLLMCLTIHDTNSKLQNTSAIVLNK